MEEMVLSRRQFFKYGLLGSTALAVGGITLGLQSTRLQDPPEELQCLNLAEYSILVAIADCLLPENPPFPAASQLDVAKHIDRLLATLHTGVATEIKLVLALIENAASNALLEQHWSPFSQSSAAEQALLLDAWRSSQLGFRRTAFKAINGLCAATYYSQPGAYNLVGYKGPPATLQRLVDQAAKN